MLCDAHCFCLACHLRAIERMGEHPRVSLPVCRLHGDLFALFTSCFRSIQSHGESPDRNEMRLLFRPDRLAARPWMILSHGLRLWSQRVSLATTLALLSYGRDMDHVGHSDDRRYHHPDHRSRRSHPLTARQGCWLGKERIPGATRPAPGSLAATNAAPRD